MKKSRKSRPSLRGWQRLAFAWDEVQIKKMGEQDNRVSLEPGSSWHFQHFQDFRIDLS